MNTPRCPCLKHDYNRYEEHKMDSTRHPLSFCKVETPAIACFASAVHG